MGFWDWFRRKDRGRDVAELARRLGMEETALRAVEPRYREFTIPKRSGGTRRILAPAPELKTLQRRILRRLLDHLLTHPAVTGFEHGESIVTNAAAHVARPVVVRMDIKNFFESTRADRVEDYFRRIGWNAEAGRLLVKLTTHKGGLPQGAPTSPRISNLVNYGLDARLRGMAESVDAEYTRYADDLTFSFDADDPIAIHQTVRLVKLAAEEEGYALHARRKLHIRRQCDRQVVTGLVVNERVNLPRETRRWLRAVEHRAAKGRKATLSPAQLAGWRALQSMIETQSVEPPEEAPPA